MTNLLSVASTDASIGHRAPKPKTGGPGRRRIGTAVAAEPRAALKVRPDLDALGGAAEQTFVDGARWVHESLAARGRAMNPG
jgi:hypothetical protein